MLVFATQKESQTDPRDIYDMQMRAHARTHAHIYVHISCGIRDIIFRIEQKSSSQNFSTSLKI
jgi:hypothetical protein